MRPLSNVRASITTLTLAILVLAGPRYTAEAPGTAQVSEYYVSTRGSNDSDGSFDHPWKTLEFAMAKLSPGDVLYLRGGTYYEDGIEFSLHSIGQTPMTTTIRSYPGERAVIDGGVPYFREVPNAEWELVDESIGLYRSRRTLSGGFVRAWLMDDDVQLVEYESEENLESTNYDPLNGTGAFYMGPGVQLRDDSHIYIRLQYNPNDLTDSLGNPINPTPSDTDPNHNRIAVSTSRHILELVDASYLHFKDLDFAYANYIMDVRNESHHIELSGCGMKYGKIGLVIRDGVRDWEIHHCEFSNGLPDHVHWMDVKDPDKGIAEAYPEFQSTAIGGSLPGFHIHHNEFRSTFDALTIGDGTTNARITENIFRYVLDDAINLYRGIRNVEVAYNMFWHVATGIANIGSDQDPGHVYIHHNVIDNSAYQRGERPSAHREDSQSVWITINPFGSHGTGNEESWWKVYNNTVVTRRGGSPGQAAGPAGVTGSSEKYVVNNIFYVIDERIVFRNDLASSGTHYDGNVVYRGAPGSLPLFVDFGDGGDYYSLDEFREDSGTDWELNGLEVDPEFSASDIDDPVFDAAAIWERYRPHNCQIFTAGASYGGLDWPGTEGVNYRGAIAPSGSLCRMCLCVGSRGGKPSLYPCIDLQQIEQPGLSCLSF